MGEIETFGVEAVTGRKTLSAREIRNLRLAANANMHVGAYHAALLGEVKQWEQWLERYPDAQKFVDWAFSEYKRWQAMYPSQ